MICPGDNLTLSCCTLNGSSLRWIVNVSLTPLHLSRGEGIRVIDQNSPEMEQPLTINQTVIHFSKISDSPLVSVLTIDNVTTNWNQTKIQCARSIKDISLTTIHTIDHSKVYTKFNMCS